MFPTLQKRSAQQAGANTETQPARVTKTYADDLGNVTHADVRLNGGVIDIERVTNSSGLRLYDGMRVTLNYAQGNRHDRYILGAAGSEAGAAALPGTGSGTASGTGGSDTTSSSTDLSSIALLMQSPDEACPSGYTLAEGANVSFDTVDPIAPVGDDDPVGGTLTIRVAPRVETVLPDATGLLDGTLVDLVDGDGASLGMYRLTGGQWIRRDSPTTSTGEGSDVTTDDRARWDGAATTAASAASDATAVKTEVEAARTRSAISGSWPAYTFANLKNHLMALWNALTARTADPTGAAVGSVLTYGSSGLAFALPPAPAPGPATATRVTGNLTLTPSDSSEAWYVVFAGTNGSNVEIVVNPGTGASGKRLHFINGVQGQFANTLQITATQGSAPSSANLVVVSTDGGDHISLEIVSYPALPSPTGSVAIGEEPPPGTPMTPVQERVQVLNVFRAAGLNADIDLGDKTLNVEGGVITGVQAT